MDIRLRGTEPRRSGSLSALTIGRLPRSCPRVSRRFGNSDVDAADFVLIDSHFHHILGAGDVALNTGATLVGSYGSMRMTAANGVPEDQLMESGGEPVQLTSRVRVRGVSQSALVSVGKGITHRF